MKRLKWSVQTAYKELINLLVIVQTTPSIGKEISNMIISLECKVNTLNVSINEFFDDLEIDSWKNQKQSDSEVRLPDIIEIKRLSLIKEF